MNRQSPPDRNTSPEQPLCFEEFRDIIDSAPIGIFQSSPQGTFLSVNPAMAEMYGFDSPAQMVKRVTDIPHQLYLNPEDREKFKTLLESRGMVTNFECRHIRTNGSTFWISMNVRLVTPKGQNAYYQGFISDITPRKKAQDEATSHLQMQGTLLEALGEGVYGVDSNGLCTFVNQAALDMLGFSRTELINQNQHLLFHHHRPDGEVYPSHDCPVFKTLKDGRTRHTQEHFFTKNGKMFPVSLTVSSLTEHTQQTGAVVVFRDTSQIKKYQETLKAIAESDAGSQEDVFCFLVRLLATSQDTRYALIASIDNNEPDIARTLAVWANDGFGENFSYNLKGTPCFDVITTDTCHHPDNVQKKFPEDHLLVELGVQSYWGTPLKDSSGQTIGLLAMLDDKPMHYDPEALSLLKSFAIRGAMEMERRSTREKFETLFETMSQGVIYQSAQGRIVEANPAAMSILGLTPDQVKKGILLAREWEFIREDGSRYPENELPAFLAYHTGKSILNKVMGILNPHQKDYIWIIITAVPLYRPGSARPYMVYTVFQDITLLKKTESSLIRAKQEAESANIAKSEFLANMSHEIRTPLNGVIGMTEHLLQSALSQDQKRFAEIIRSSGETLLTLINDILDFSKIEAGRLELATSDFDLPVLLDEFSRNMAQRARDKGLAFDFIKDPKLPSCVRGDELRLLQVLTNLTGNALKFTDTGKITLKAFMVSQSPASCMVEFSVMDTGIGIPEDKIHLLFHKFSQVDTTAARKYGGTGLGLAISKQLVKLMNGEIQATSIPGRGSKFSFTVELGVDVQDCPRHEPKLGNNNQALNVRGDQASEILLVEDNKINQMVVMKNLKNMGHRVHLAHNGVEAVQAFEKKSFDLILMDIQMPGMDGLEATRKIRKIEDNMAGLNIPGKDHGRTGQADPKQPPSGTNNQSGAFRVPIIALTAHAMKEDREKGFEAGMDDYLTKPVRSRDLADMLTKWIPMDLNPADMTGKNRSSPLPPEEQPEPSPYRVFDQVALMDRLANDLNAAREIAQLFLHTIPDQIHEIKACLGENRLKKAGRTAHSIKGTAANTGCMSLAKTAGRIEAAGKNGDSDKVKSLIQVLEKDFELVRQEMKKFIG
ncbi:PAS domain S-box protein [Desulfonatronovibrio hydrogenovorans]|uniref:PAS domain S-box protein n=1 Tax=Desulfonatronovibrio hydrogenovorans TaxID=53245 RepID=UPI00068B4162|nr:PAS domain S-box protein [Desulfonatronovibrio hydrogenovorans]